MADTGCFRHKLIVLFIAALIGCSTHTNDSGQTMGGESTGGGDASVSTPDQVNTAIDKALALSSELNPQKNIVVQFWKSKGQTSKSNFISAPTHVFPQFVSPDESSRFNAPFYQALKQNKIVRLQKGDCPHPADETTAAASVSEHTFNATICFSIGNLTRIPQSSLLQEITGLVLHEVTHMGGAGEPEAKEWQNEFIRYFIERFGNVLVDDTAQTTLMISKAYRLLNRAQSFAQKDASDRHILPDMMAAIDTIAALPDSGDELALAIKINPPHPELIGAYVAAVAKVVATIRLKIENKYGPIYQSSDEPKVMSSSGDVVDEFNALSLLSELASDINEVNETFLAFTQK